MSSETALEAGQMESGSIQQSPAESAHGAPHAITILRSVNSHFFEVQLEVFDGPIDLLLHLVKQNELGIEKISLARVTHQYLQCLEAMQSFDLEIAGEYLVIAATLLSLKSSLILAEPSDALESLEEAGESPHDELLRRLREAAIFKEGAQQLGSRPLLNSDVFAPKSTLAGVEAPPARLKEHDAMLLAKAFEKLIAKAKQRDPTFVITIEHISIVARMHAIVETLKSHGGRVEFEKLIPGELTRHSLVASFVAMLELCKRQLLAVEQVEVDGAVIVSFRSAESEAPIQDLTSEFDEDTASEAHASAGNS